jgi:hypothetical protein
MTRSIPVAALLGLLIAAAPSHGDDDPIRKRLDEAKAAHEKSMKEYADAVTGWFEAEDAAARKLKTGVTEKVKQVAAEKKLFDERGYSPSGLRPPWERGRPRLTPLWSRHTRPPPMPTPVKRRTRRPPPSKRNIRRS